MQTIESFKANANATSSALHLDLDSLANMGIRMLVMNASYSALQINSLNPLPLSILQVQIVSLTTLHNTEHEKMEGEFDLSFPTKNKE